MKTVGFDFVSQTHPRHEPPACLHRLKKMFYRVPALFTDCRESAATELNIFLQKPREGNASLLPQ